MPRKRKHYTTYHFRISFIEKNGNERETGLSYSNSPDVMESYLPETLDEVLSKVCRDWKIRLPRIKFILMQIQIHPPKIEN